MFCANAPISTIFLTLFGLSIASLGDMTVPSLWPNTVTGSGRGIGKETAIQLAQSVTNVVVCSRTQNEIDSVVKEIENVNNSQVNVLGLRCDVSVSSDVNSLVQSAIDKFGSETINILVNNAGVAFDNGPFCNCDKHLRNLVL
jgi:NAD(P)-dependent dehydrogenase (short-subunit alcohol dehydrogenase family)